MVARNEVWPNWLPERRAGKILEVILVKSDMGHLAEYSELSHDSKKYKIYLQGHQKYCYHFWRPEDMREYSLQSFKAFNSG